MQAEPSIAVGTVFTSTVEFSIGAAGGGVTFPVGTRLIFKGYGLSESGQMMWVFSPEQPGLLREGIHFLAWAATSAHVRVLQQVK